MNAVSKEDVVSLVKHWSRWRNQALAAAKSLRNANAHETAGRYEVVANTYLCCINDLENEAGIPLEAQSL